MCAYLHIDVDITYHILTHRCRYYIPHHAYHSVIIHSHLRSLRSNLFIALLKSILSGQHGHHSVHVVH